MEDTGGVKQRQLDSK